MIDIAYITYVCIASAGVGGVVGWLYGTPQGEIYRLKRRARKLIYAMRELQNAYSCGIALMREMSPDYRRMEAELFTIMECCKKIDPAAPQKIPERGKYL